MAWVRIPGVLWLFSFISNIPKVRDAKNMGRNGNIYFELSVPGRIILVSALLN
jgi:hypothetical protein